MTEFPISLLEILIEPNIGNEVLIEPVDTTPTSLLSIIAPGLQKLKKQQEAYEAERVFIQGKIDRNEFKNWPERQFEMSRLGRLPSYVKFLDDEILEITNEVKRMEEEGYFLPNFSYLPPSAIAGLRQLPRISYRDFSIGGEGRDIDINVHFRIDSCFLKVKPLYILPLDKLLGNLPKYEGISILTRGLVLGIGQESHNVEQEGYSYTTYVRSCILGDELSDRILELEEPESRYNNTHIKRVVPRNGHIEVQKINPSRVFAYLDASKTKRLPIIVGGMVNKGRLRADMFVTQLGSEKQVFAYVVFLQKS